MNNMELVDTEPILAFAESDYARDVRVLDLLGRTILANPTHCASLQCESWFIQTDSIRAAELRALALTDVKAHGIPAGISIANIEAIIPMLDEPPTATHVLTFIHKRL